MGLSRTITILLCWRSINPKRHKAWRHDKTYSVEIHGSTNEGSRKHNLDLPNQFSLAIDDWSKGSTHFVGLFAAYTEPNKRGTRRSFCHFRQCLMKRTSLRRTIMSIWRMSWAYTRRRSKMSWRSLGTTLLQTNELVIAVGSNSLDVHLSDWILPSPLIWSAWYSWYSLGKSEHSYGKTEEPEVGRYTSRTYKLETHS